LYFNNTAITKDTLKTSNTVVNQTRKYLIPQFKHYGMDFIEHIRENDLKGCFLQDHGVGKSNEIKPEVYFLFDVNGPSQYGHYIDIKKARLVFMKTLAYLRSKPYYVIDYPFDSNKDGHFHVIVLKMPFPEKLKTFLKGEYSKMYSKEEIEKYIPKSFQIEQDGEKVTIETDVYQVVTKKPAFLEVFKEKVYTEFKSRHVDSPDEYDFPPYFPNEILRYEGIPR